MMANAKFGRRQFHALSYNITGESAPIFFQSKKCSELYDSVSGMIALSHLAAKK